MRKVMMTMTTLLALGLGAVAVGCDDDEGDGGEGASAASTADTSLPGDPEAGEAVYQRVCLACHGADGRGNGGVTGADFIGDTSRLAKDNDLLVAHIRDGILDKSPPMPPQGGVLSEQEIKDALSYIRREFGGTQQ